MRKRDGLQEPGEPVQIAHQPLHLNLFAHVDGDVALQRVDRVVGTEHQREHAALQRRRQIERGLQLRGHEGMHDPHHGSAGHEIDTAASELARAGSGQHEPPAALLFYEGVDGTEQIRDSLDLVDDDHVPVGLSAHQIEEAVGARTVARCRVAGWSRSMRTLSR